MKQGEETPSTLYVFASQCGGEELSYATSSVGDRGEWAQAVGTTIVAGNSRGGLHGAGVRMTICVRAGWARAVGAMMRVVAEAVADMIARHETGRAIHAVMSRKIGMTAGAVVHLDAADGPLAHHAATGTTHAAAVAARLTVRVIAQVIARCVGDARRYARTGTRPLAGVAALAILEPHAARRRAEDSGATKTVAHVVVPAWVAQRACARDPRMARGGRGMPPPEPEKGQLSFSKGFGIVAGMFVLGIAVAFGFFMLTRPNPQLNDTPPAPTNTTAPDLTPTVAPNITPSPSGRAPGAGPAFVFVFAGASQ